jgi:hypothetical protein
MFINGKSLHQGGSILEFLSVFKNNPYTFAHHHPPKSASHVTGTVSFWIQFRDVNQVGNKYDTLPFVFLSGYFAALAIFIGHIWNRKTSRL